MKMIKKMKESLKRQSFLSWVALVLSLLALLKALCQ